MAPRSDIHRAGAFIPADYDHVLSYNLSHMADGWPVPSFGVNCQLDRRQVDKDGRVLANGEHNPNLRCCVVGLRMSGLKYAEYGSTGKCTACGAVFVYGDVWQHRGSGELVHLGHICADKYNMLADRSEWELVHDRAVASAKAASAAALTRKFRLDDEARFYDEHPGLRDELALDHPILRDLKDKVYRYGSLSEKQIALAHKLADEVRNPKPAEVLIPAPVGDKVVVRGRVVGVKSYESAYGDQLKMTVKVESPEGVWLAWGSVPSGLLGGDRELRGSLVEFTARLNPGRDSHFALINRPRLARVIEEAPVEGQQGAGA
jgi:hypothetical protein